MQQNSVVECLRFSATKCQAPRHSRSSQFESHLRANRRHRRTPLDLDLMILDSWCLPCTSANLFHKQITWPIQFVFIYASCTPHPTACGGAPLVSLVAWLFRFQYRVPSISMAIVGDLCYLSGCSHLAVTARAYVLLKRGLVDWRNHMPKPM